MRRGKHRKFGREAGQRQALYRALATALIDHGKIKTTEAKAKSLTSHLAKLITTAKKGDLAARRLLLTKIGEKSVSKLMADIAPNMSGRNGGYRRTMKLGQRRSDSAPMVIIAFVK